MRYRLIEGLPATVETEVDNLLATGLWELNGEPFPRLSAEGVHLVVQSVIRIPERPMTISRVGKGDEVYDVSTD